MPTSEDFMHREAERIAQGWRMLAQTSLDNGMLRIKVIKLRGIVFVVARTGEFDHCEAMVAEIDGSGRLDKNRRMPIDVYREYLRRWHEFSRASRRERMAERTRKWLQGDKDKVESIDVYWTAVKYWTSGKG